MAEIGIVEQFRATHGSNPHEHDFKAEIVVEGRIGFESGYVEGVDHKDLISDLKDIISDIADKDLKEILGKEGYKSSGNESIASFFAQKLKNKYPLKFVRIWETDERYATVYKDEFNNPSF